MSSCYAFGHLSDGALLQALETGIANDRKHTALLLAILAEVDERKLYLPAAYPSMYAYCVGALDMSEQSAFKRIRVARMARQFPAILPAIADGRLNSSAVLLLTPYLTEERTAELLSAAANKSKTEIEQLLAERFPRPDLMTWVEEGPSQVPARTPATQLSPGTVSFSHTEPASNAHAAILRATARPLSSERIGLQMTVRKSTQEKLRYAQDLLSHVLPSGDIGEVIDRALDALIPQLERQKFAATSRPRTPRATPSSNPRQVPAHVRRAVWERDGGRCTFVSEGGRRCSERRRLEFDHGVEVARGGKATVDRMRLRCRPHNQYGAEQTFGAEFMRHKRIAAAEARAASENTTDDGKLDVMNALRSLKYTTDELRRAVAYLETTPPGPLEQRIGAAIRYLGQTRSVGRRIPSPS